MLLNTRTIYGFPKVYKFGVFVRPILASYFTYNYNLSKFLISFLTSFRCICIPNEYILQNSYNFKSWLFSVTNLQKYYLSSFDIESLYTNIPTSDKYILSTSHFYYICHSQSSFFWIIWIQRTLTSVTSVIYFYLNYKLYCQSLKRACPWVVANCKKIKIKKSNSLVMGSPLSAILANICLKYLALISFLQN